MSEFERTFADVGHQVALMSPGLQMVTPSERQAWSELVEEIASRSGPRAEKVRELAELVEMMPETAMELANARVERIAAICERHKAALRTELDRLEAEVEGSVKGGWLSRYRSRSAYGHSIKRLPMGYGYRLHWTVDRYYPSSMLRHPIGYSRDTDEAGALRFAKKHGVEMPKPREE